MAATVLSSTASFKADVPKFLQQPGPHYVVFTSDIVDGKYWCGDCVRAVPGIQAAAASAGAALMEVRVGPRDAWREKTHPLRVDPAVMLAGIPTLFRLSPDGALGKRSGPDLEGAEDAAAATQIAGTFITATR